MTQSVDFIPKNFTPPSFDIADVNNWKQYFQEQGYVVINNVLNDSQIKTAKTLLWEFLTNLNSNLNRNDSTSWINSNWPQTALKKGIVSGYGAGQSEFMWYLRKRESIKIPFAKIWNCDIGNLVPSFDGFSIFRPLNNHPEWKTDDSLWYHVDQNGHDKPGFICVQGQVLLTDSDEHDGGFVLIPKSQSVFCKIFQRLPDLGKGEIDFIRFNPTDINSPWYYEFKDYQLSPVKLCVQKGSMVLWDSRTTHCNVAAKPKSDEDPNELRRITAFISFAPRAHLTGEDIIRRVDCYQSYGTSTHWVQSFTHPNEKITRPTKFNLPDDSKVLSMI